MTIRKLKPEEHGITRPLYQEVFSEDSDSFVDYYYTEKTKDNEIYVLEEDAGIRAMLHLNPYRLMVNGTEKQAYYIVAVATQECYRKRGYMRELLKRALTDMRRSGESFTFLMPAAEAIYLPHDFRTVYEQKRSFYDPKRDSGKMQKAVKEDCAGLAALANVYLKERYQVYALRDEAYYVRLLKEYGSEGGSLMIERQDGRIANCLPYVPGDTKEEEPPKIMIRILDVRRMLLSLSLKSLTAVCFEITDPILEDNNQCVVLTGTEFSGAMLMEGKPENSEGTLTIAALASLLFGAKTVEEVCRETGVFMSERMKKEMTKIIPLSRIYLNETV